jgi:hypothetical protein
VQGEQIAWWLGHTFLSIPLHLAIYHLKIFIEKYPSEVIILECRPDYSPVNADKAGMAKHDTSSVLRLVGRNNSDLLTYIVQELGDHIMLCFNTEMKVSDFTGKGKNILLFFEGTVFPEKNVELKSSWTDTKDFVAPRNIQRCREWCMKE